MDRPKLTAKELYRRYRQGDRHFEAVDLSGESLRGLNLRGINLTNADLSHTDLRGTNFTAATIKDTCLSVSKAGTLRRWVIPKLLIAGVLIDLTSLLVTVAWAYFAVQILDPGGSNTLTNTSSGDIIAGTLGLIFLIGLLSLSYYRGILATLTTAIVAIAIAVVIAIAGAIAGAFGIVLTVAFAIAVAGAVSITGIFAFAIVGAVAVSIAVSIAVAVAIAIAIAGGFAVYITFAIAIAVTFAGAAVTLLVSYLISRRALGGDPRDRLVRDAAVWVASWGGTQFTGANLTDADFSKAVLKNAHFGEATLTRTRFHLAEKVNLARLGNTLLSDFAVQDLLITLRGRGKSYVGHNLKGANLMDADLADANFTEANLSRATLKGATLHRVNFTKTQALGTQFVRPISPEPVWKLGISIAPPNWKAQSASMSTCSTTCKSVAPTAAALTPVSLPNCLKKSSKPLT